MRYRLLSARIAGLRKYQVGIVYRHLKERREAEGRWRAAGCEITPEEYRALAEACRDLPLRGRFLSYARDILVHHFRADSPGSKTELTSWPFWSKYQAPR